ncbi:MAG TPA: hypothetical protein PLF16_02720 [Candidatus Staskawiczbacteria bacterium]|nr:hypothetical protein [Candidatus Staskawiczbacteria bacterium]
MTTAVLSALKIARAAKPRARVKTFESPQINWAIFCILGTSLCIVSLLFYIWQINALTNKTYLIGKYEDEIKEISQENKKLEVSFAEKAILGSVTEKAQSLNLQKTTAIKYIQVSELTMAGAK